MRKVEQLSPPYLRPQMKHAGPPGSGVFFIGFFGFSLAARRTNLPRNNRSTRRQCQIGPHPGLAFTQIAVPDTQINQRLWREFAAVLIVVAKPEHWQDQRGKDDAGPKRTRIAPHFAPAPRNRAFTKASKVLKPINQVGAFHGRFRWPESTR